MLSDIKNRYFTKERFVQLIFDFIAKSVTTIKNEKEMIINELMVKCPICRHLAIEG
ncbi:hypothetical protein bcgnr5391_10600 [Bacillus cereus]